MSPDARTINRAAGAATVVGVYSLYNAAALALTPDTYIKTPAHALVFAVVDRHWLALVHVMLGLALLGSLRATWRLAVAMIICALYFVFWASVTVVPALLGLVPAGNTLGLGAYLFAAGYAAYWALRMLRARWDVEQ